MYLHVMCLTSTLCLRNILLHIPSSLHPDSGSQIQLSRDKLNNEEGSRQGRNWSLTFLGRVRICVHSLRALRDP